LRINELPSARRRVIDSFPPANTRLLSLGTNFVSNCCRSVNYSLLLISPCGVLLRDADNLREHYQHTLYVHRDESHARSRARRSRARARVCVEVAREAVEIILPSSTTHGGPLTATTVAIYSFLQTRFAPSTPLCRQRGKSGAVAWRINGRAA